MKKNIILIFLILILFLIVNGQTGCEQAECYSKTDCSKVQLTCCPCNMGGQEKCVPRIMASLYEEKLKECPPPEELICPALYNCKIADCDCVEGYCKAVPEQEE